MSTEFAADSPGGAVPPVGVEPSGGVDALVGVVPVQALSGQQLLDELIRLDGVLSVLQCRRLALIAQVQALGVTEQVAGIGTVSWLAQHTRTSRRAAAGSVRLAVDLHQRLPELTARFATGQVSLEQAQAGAAAIRDLPTTTSPGGPDVHTVRARADQVLAGFVDTLSVDQFAVAARRMAALISTEAGTRTFERQHTARRVSLGQLLDGSWHLDGRLDAEAGALVQTALDSLSRPLGVSDQRPAWHRRADALAEICAQYLNTGLAPTSGGVRPHLQITITAADLLNATTGSPGTNANTNGNGPRMAEPNATKPSTTNPGTGAALGTARSCTGTGTGTGTGARWDAPNCGTARTSADHAHGGTRDQADGGDDLPSTPARRRANSDDVDKALQILREAAGLGDLNGAGPIPPTIWHRLLCDSDIRRVVLDPDSMPLNVGRATRLATGAQRAALIVRDKGCAHPGCHRPASWTDAHHIQWVRNGGKTNLDNLVLLCRYHHGQVHDGTVVLTINNTDLIFTRNGRELGRHQLRAGP